MALPPLTPEQRAEALQKAAIARKERAEVKNRLKRGAVTLSAVIKDGSTDDVIGKMKVSALLESRAHFNLFNHLHPLLPGLQYNNPALTAGLTPEYLDRSGVMRVYASSAHPIELSAVLVMAIPLAAYLAKTTGQRRLLSGSYEQIREDVRWLGSCGVTEVFYDLNFDPAVGDPAADEGKAVLRASEILEALAPGARM